MQPLPSQDRQWSRFDPRSLGELVLPSDEAYQAARRVWNGPIDRRPALIARCSGFVDVVRAVELAYERTLLVPARSGGANVAGHGTCDGGIAIDLTDEGVDRHLARGTIRVEAGRSGACNGSGGASVTHQVKPRNAPAGAETSHVRRSHTAAGGPPGTRTPNLRIKSPMLCQLS
jgi:hypothetical protein